MGIMTKQQATESLQKTNKTIEESIEKTLASARKAIETKDLSVYALMKERLGKLAKAKTSVIAHLAYADLMDAENPVKAAVEKFFVDSVLVKETSDKDTGEIQGIEVVTKQRGRRVNLAEMTEFLSLDKAWINLAGDLLARLTLRETNIFKMSAEEMSKRNLYFIKAALEKKSGGTPDSNRQLTSLLQEIVDNALRVEYKVTNHDLRFIDDCVLSLNAKEKASLSVMTAKQFISVLMSVFAHILGEAYSVKSRKPEKTAEEAEVPVKVAAHAEVAKETEAK